MTDQELAIICETLRLTKDEMPDCDDMVCILDAQIAKILRIGDVSDNDNPLNMILQS